MIYTIFYSITDYLLSTFVPQRCLRRFGKMNAVQFALKKAHKTSDAYYKSQTEISELKAKLDKVNSQYEALLVELFLTKTLPHSDVE